MAWLRLVGKKSKRRRGEGGRLIEREKKIEGEEGRDGWLVGKKSKRRRGEGGRLIVREKKSEEEEGNKG